MAGKWKNEAENQTKWVEHILLYNTHNKWRQEVEKIDAELVVGKICKMKSAIKEIKFIFEIYSEMINIYRKNALSDHKS